MIIFGDNGQGCIIGIGNIRITPSTSIQSILLDEGLKHNLLNISQFCDKEFKITFESLLCIVFSPNDNGIMFIRHRNDNIYMMDLDDLHMKNGQCPVATDAKVNETS